MDVPPPESLEIPSLQPVVKNPLPLRSRRLPVLLGSLLLCALLVVLIGIYAFNLRKRQTVVQQDADTQERISVEVTPELLINPSTRPVIAAQGSIGSSPLPTASPVTISTPGPTTIPVVVSQDLSIKPNSGSVVRYYNDGTAKGFVEQNMKVQGSLSPSYDALSSYWKTQIKACATLLVKKSISSAQIPVSIWIDSSPKLTATYDPVTTFLPSVEYRYCNTMPTTDSVGTHSVHLKMNETSIINEQSYSNNEIVMTYTVVGDTIAPTFTIFGPHVETEGTCMHLNDIADNISTNAQMTIEHKMDNGAWGPSDASRQCVQGPVGEQHTYYGKVTDAAGNTTEKRQVFTIQ